MGLISRHWLNSQFFWQLEFSEPAAFSGGQGPPRDATLSREKRC